MDSNKKTLKLILFFGIVYLFIFFVLNSIEFLNWVRKEISPPKRVRVSEEEYQKITGALITQKEDSIEVPKIDIEAPLVLIKDPEEEDFYPVRGYEDTEESKRKQISNDVKGALNKGVVLHPGSVLPDEKGEIFILGHSAPLGWPRIHYDRVFSGLNKLEPGDEVFINFQGKRYSYTVTQKFFLERGEEMPENLEEQKSILYLISCWPPGRDTRRIAVQTTSSY